MKTLSAIFIGLTALVWGGCASAPGQAPVPAAATASRARVPMYFHLPTKDGKAITVDAIGVAAADRLTVRNQVMEYLKAQLIAQTATWTEAELAGGRLAEVISTAKAATLKHAQELKIAGVELTVTQVQITSM